MIGCRAPPRQDCEKRREDARDRRGASARATERRARGAGGRKRTYELGILRRREVIAQKLLRREPHGTGDKRSRVFFTRFFLTNALTHAGIFHLRLAEPPNSEGSGGWTRTESAERSGTRGAREAPRAEEPGLRVQEWPPHVEPQENQTHAFSQTLIV